MVISWWWPLALLVIGLLLWFFTNNKPSEAGRIAFAVGLFVFTWVLAHGSISVSVR